MGINGQFHVINGAGTDAEWVRAQIEDSLYMAHLCLIDTGPQDKDAQKIALQYADFVLVVGSPSWGAERATKVLAGAVRKLSGGKPVLIINNMFSGYDNDETGAIRIPRLAGIEESLMDGSTGGGGIYADRILAKIGEVVGGLGGERPTVVSIIGGKGGVGKSTVATLLGLRIKEQQGVSALLDLDNQVGNISSVANQDEELSQGRHVRWQGDY